MSDTYCYLHLAGEGRDSLTLQAALEGSVLGAWRQAGITPWGVWEGLFGVASNELLVMAAGPGEQAEEDFIRALDGIEVVSALTLVPTVRPLESAPCTREGLYVFRFFGVRNADVDEIARLSATAWETFEADDGYRAEPQGLFRQQDLSAEVGRMLLVTWYDGLQSWQTSRQPPVEARENFQRRRELTLGTRALATRLLAPFGG